MPVPTTNDGSTYYNVNQCRSFKQTLTLGTLVALTAQPCSEVEITNRTGGNMLVFDNNYFGHPFGMLMKNDETRTFRGVTSSSVVSASGGGDIYYRTAFFSMLPQR